MRKTIFILSILALFASNGSATKMYERHITRNYYSDLEGNDLEELLVSVPVPTLEAEKTDKIIAEEINGLPVEEKDCSEVEGYETEMPYLTPDSSIFTLTDKQRQGVLEVVKIWIEEMFKTENVNRLMQVSDIPFEFDRDTVSTRAKLKEMYLALFEDKGKRTIPKYEVHLLDLQSDKLVTVGVIFREKDCSVSDAVIYVLIHNNTIKIVGFKD